VGSGGRAASVVEIQEAAVSVALVEEALAAAVPAEAGKASDLKLV